MSFTFPQKIKYNSTKYFITVFICILVFLNLFTFALSNDSNANDQNNPKEEDDVFKKILAIKVRHIEGLGQILNETDLTYMAYFYVKSSENSKKGAEFLSKIAEKLDFLAGILLIDCDDFTPKDIEYCLKDPNAKDGYPKMVIYKPPEYRVNPYTKEKVPHTEIVYDKREVSEPTIYNFITSHILNKSVKLNDENIEGFLSNILYNKVILFTDKTQTPLLYRGLSSFYYDRLLFGEVEKDNTALLKRFNVQTFPTLLVYNTQEDNIYLDEPRIETYKDAIASRNIVMFINQFALPEKLYLKVAKTENVDDLKYKIAIKDLNNENYLKYFEKFNSKRFIIYLSENDVIPEDLKKFSKFSNGFFIFAKFNCGGENAEFCSSTFKVKTFPSILLIHKSVLGENKKEINTLKDRLEKPVRLSMDYTGIVNEILIEFPSEVKDANPMNFSNLLSSANLGKRIPIVYFYEEEIPLGLSLISTDQIYKKYVDFLGFSNPSQEIMKNFQIKKLPATILIIPDNEKPGNARIVSYNEELVFSRLKNFIDQSFNVERNTKQYIPEETIQRRDLEFIQDNKKLKDDCLKANKKLCIFGLFDGRVKKESQRSFENSVKILEEVLNLKQNIPYYFGWVNATCHDNFLNTFEVDINSIPNLVVYIPSKDVYTNLLGSFDIENIDSFIQRVINGKVHFRKIYKEKVRLAPIKCENIKDVTENLEEDEILKEILEEQKIKLEEQERERQREALNKEVKKKKKKKSDL